MIKLALEQYCQDCTHIEPVATTAYHTSFATGEKSVETVIMCERCEECREIAKHIDGYYSKLH